MRRPDSKDMALRELCFDLEAGILDRPAFSAQVHDLLRRRMDCEQVLLRCTSPATAALLARLRGEVWLSEFVDGQFLLHVPLALNTGLIGVLSCVRVVPGPAWTMAEGVTLRRLATVLTNHSGCQMAKAADLFEQEGVFP